MEIPAPSELFRRIARLPAAAPLMARLSGPAEPPVYLVGGAVRDLLLGGQPEDLDLVVEGDPAAIAASLGGEVRLHDRFGTCTVTFEGHSYDIARARGESYARPGALPDVEPARLDEDLLRRDFTVNAMAIALSGERTGELAAVPHAREDMEARRLRVLHDRSFLDDPTRMLRLVRYASRLGFEIEPHTRELLDRAVADGALTAVSGPRLGAELRLLAREEDPVAALLRLRYLSLDAALEPGFGLEEIALAHRALALLPADGRRDRLALALAGRGLSAPQLTSMLETWAFEAADRDAIVSVATRADELARSLRKAERPSQIAQAVDHAELELVALAGALGPARQAEEWLSRLRRVRLEIDGRNLLEAGIPAGPAVGRGLRAALAAKLDGRTTDCQSELAEALRAAQ